MTTLEDRDAMPLPAMPVRPMRPLSLFEILKTRGVNSLALCDETLFDDLFVERRLLSHRVFVASHPDAVRRVLITNFENYRRHFLMVRPISPGLGSGMLINDGAVWRRHKRLLTPLLDYRAIVPDVPEMIRWAEWLADRTAALPPDEVIDIGLNMSRLISVGAAWVYASGNEDVRSMITRMAKFPGERRLSDYLQLPYWLSPRAYGIRAAARSWYPLIDRLLADRERPDYAGRHDLLWRLLHARSSDGDSLSRQEIRDEILTLSVGGIETTLRPMTWVWYLLALHPEVEERLHAELDAVLAGRSPTADDLRRLPYLRQVLDETLRLYPPVPVMLRTAAADDELCGQMVPRGSTIVVSPWIIHRHRRLWDDPDRFDPERFAPERNAARPRMSYLPFAIGPRACIGAPLATLQLSLATALLASRFRFRLAPDHKVTPVGWTTLRPQAGIRVTVEQRGRR